MDLTQDIFLAVLRAMPIWRRGKACLPYLAVSGSPPTRSFTPAAGSPPTQALEDQEVPLERILRAWLTVFSWIRSRPTSRL